MTIFSVAAVVLTAFFLSVGSFRAALPRGLSLGIVVRIVPYVSLDALRYAVPASLLLALNMTYGRMAFHNEILALQSAGVSPVRAVLPGLHVAALLCLPTVWLTDLAVTWGHDGVQRVVRESVQDFFEATLREKGSYATAHFSLVVKRLNGSELIRPLLTLYPTHSQPAVVITAEHANFVPTPDRAELSIAFRQGEVRTADDVVYQFPDTHTVSFSLDEVNVETRDEHYSLRDLQSRIRESSRRLEDLQAELQSISRSFSLGNADGARVSELEKAIDVERDRFNELRSKPHRRWAHGMSCLAFAVFAIPWATRCRTGDIFHSFLLGFVPILLFYYPIEMLLASNSNLPPWSIWLADGALLVCGCWLQFWLRPS